MENTITIKTGPSVITRIITSIICVILSIFLVGSLILMPFIEDVRLFTKEENLEAYTNSIVFEDVREQLKSIDGFSEEDRQVYDFILGAITTDAGKELLDIYVQEIIKGAKGETPNVVLNGDMIYRFLKENLDEVFAYIFDQNEIQKLKDKVADGSMTQQEYDAEIDDALKDVAYGFADELPDFNELKEGFTEIATVATAFGAFVAPVFFWGFAIFALILSVAIFFIKSWNRKGLVWLIADFCIVWALVMFAGFIIGTAGKTMELIPGDTFSLAAPFVKPLLIFFSKKTLRFALLYAFIAAGLIVWKVAYSAKQRKKARGPKVTKLERTRPVEPAKEKEVVYGYQEAEMQQKKAEEPVYGYQEAVPEQKKEEPVYGYKETEEKTDDKQ